MPIGKFRGGFRGIQSSRHISFSRTITPINRIFRPEDYGIPTGTDPSVDMQLVQSAINAAANEGGGTVRLERIYAYIHSGNRTTLGPYRNVDYGFHVNHSNITIDGCGTGALKLVGFPTFTNSYIGFLVGNGGYTGIYPGWDIVKATGTWIENVAIKNLTFDNSFLSDTDLGALTGGVISSCLLFAFCRNCMIENITVDRGWGITGAISTHCSSILNVVRNCTVDQSHRVAYWFDGAEDSTFENLECNSFLDTVNANGLTIAVNTDYFHGPSRNAVKNCTLSGVHTGIGIGGEGNIVDGNTVNVIVNNTTHVCVSVGALANAHGKWAGMRNTIRNNNFVRGVSGGPRGFGVQLDGINANNYDGLPLESAEANIYGNTFGEQLGQALVLGPQANRNVFQHNTILCNTAVFDNSGGTATGNIIEPNP